MLKGEGFSSFFPDVMSSRYGPCFQEATRHRCPSMPTTNLLPSFLTNVIRFVRLGLHSNYLFFCFCHRYIPSQADVHVFQAITSAPDPSSHPHVARWYAHIKSYAAEHSDLPGSSTAGKAFTETAAPPAAAEEEEDIDLFGEDEEEDAEAERLKAERVAAYNAKKASKPKPVSKVRTVYLLSNGNRVRVIELSV
jgi:Eukaryotic elongation factor 1 beta central acidic region